MTRNIAHSNLKRRLRSYILKRMCRQSCALAWAKQLPDVLLELLQMRTPAAAQAEVMNVFGTQPSRIYGSTAGAATSYSRGHNLDGQRGKIMDLLQREKDNYEAIGLSESDIKSAIGAVNMDALRKDLQFLVNEGHIYNTTDDEHYALID
ncbi:replication protein A [Cooperia oncophora]